MMIYDQVFVTSSLGSGSDRRDLQSDLRILVKLVLDHEHCTVDQLRTGKAFMQVVMEQAPSRASPPPRSLDRQVVLEEDEYTEALSHIIKRDFFPSLVHLDATNNYLDALRSEDPQLINASVRQLQDLATPAPSSRRYQPLQTPSQTPWAAGPSDTPLHPAYSESLRPQQKRPRYDADMSLDAFQTKYTSEDNSSFVQILDDENRKRKEVYGWAWEAQKKVEMQRERMLEGREQMLTIEQGSVPGVKERLVIEPPKPNAGLIEDAPKEKDEESKSEEEKEKDEEEEGKGKEVAVVLKSEKDEKQVDVMAPKKDTRPAGVDGWRFKVCTFNHTDLQLLDTQRLLGSECIDVCSRRRYVSAHCCESCSRSESRRTKGNQSLEYSVTRAKRELIRHVGAT